MDHNGRLLFSFEQVHPDYANTIRMIADAPGTMSMMKASRDPPRSESEAAEFIMYRVEPFVTSFVPNKMFCTDADWLFILSAVRAFYFWAYANSHIALNEKLDRGLVKLSKFRLGTLPNVITMLGSEQYWEKVERGDKAAVAKCEAKVPGWLKRDLSGAIREFILEEYEIDYAQYEFVFLKWANPYVESVQEDGWKLDTSMSNSGIDSVFMRLPKEVAKLGMRGMELSCCTLALRKGIWRPLRGDCGFVANAYPSCNVFYDRDGE